MRLDRENLLRLLDRPGVRTCLDALREPSEETRLVGGCVRDALIGWEVADIDLATTLEPARVLEKARAAGLNAVPTGFDHGTVTLFVGGEPFEVTTLREDIETDGRHAVVCFGRDFARDAERRDFTINALFLDADGHVYDHAGGLDDLASGRVRFIGEPATRIREDALRILRFFRFHARYGEGAPYRAGLAACIAARAALDRLSRERVRAELLKLLLAPHAVDALASMSESGLLSRITGGVAELGRLSRASRPGSCPAARLAALAVLTREDANRLRERLRLSKAEHERLVAYAAALADLRSRDFVDARALRALLAEHGPEAVHDASAAIAGEPRPCFDASAHALLDAAEPAPVLPLTGGDLVAHGLAPGRAVGRGLSAARTLWLDEGCPTDKSAYERLLQHALAVAQNEKPAVA